VIAAVVSGLGLGFLVAAQVGPIWLLCARTAARFGFWPGFAVGLGAAGVDLAYAVLGALGAAILLQATALRVGLGLVGAAVLLWLGGRTLHTAFRVRLGAETPDEVVAPGRAFRTAVVATASNPLTIVSWGAVFGGAAAAEVLTGAGTATAFVLAIGVGSMLFHLVLAAVMAVVGGRVGERGLRAVDAVSGIGLVGFGGLLAYRTVTDT
jgi:putative LysE/RhtB family amino acid efflux pump